MTGTYYTLVDRTIYDKDSWQDLAVKPRLQTLSYSNKSAIEQNLYLKQTGLDEGYTPKTVKFCKISSSFGRGL